MIFLNYCGKDNAMAFALRMLWNTHWAYILLIFNKVICSNEPEFAEPIYNITVAAGRDATLACVIDELGTYKVAWINNERQAILTVHRHVITRNPRVSITHNNLRAWYLHIKNIKESDSGGYMCQINTEPVKAQLGYINVVVPPDIIDSETSSEVISREGNNVTLVCKARGSPQPNITWKREDHQKFTTQVKTKPVLKADGDLLEIVRVSRLHMGAYLCIASNGIPPSVSKRVILKVDFPPMLWIPHQLVGAPQGYEARLECTLEAHPKSISYWSDEHGSMIFPSDKYQINVTELQYTLTMVLNIKRLQKADFGSYKCIGKNPLGETEGSIRLYETEAPSTLSSTVVYDRIEDRRHKKENGGNSLLPSSLLVQDNTEDGPLAENKSNDEASSATHLSIITNLIVVILYFLVRL